MYVENSGTEALYFFHCLTYKMVIAIASPKNPYIQGPWDFWDWANTGQFISVRISLFFPLQFSQIISSPNML